MSFKAARLAATERILWKAEAFLRAFANEGKWTPERATAQASSWIVSDYLRNYVLPELDRLRTSLALRDEVAGIGSKS